MRVSWLQLTLVEATGFVKEYRISYFKVAERRRQILSETVPGTTSSIVIGGLDPDDSYMVFILSSTSAGEGPSSEGIRIEGTYCVDSLLLISLVHLPPLTAPTTVLIQLRAGDFQPCTSWTDDTEASLITFIRTIVIDIVTERCGCGFMGDHINDEELLCDPSNPTSAVYRAKISSTNTVSADDVVPIIEQWISGGATVTVGLTIVTFDGTCPVRISSTSDPICEVAVSSSPLPTSTNAPLIHDAIIGTIVTVVIVLIAILFTIVIVIILWQRRINEKR